MLEVIVTCGIWSENVTVGFSKTESGLRILLKNYPLVF